MAQGMLLIDGLFRGTWRITRHQDTAVLYVEPFERAAIASEHDAIASEGERLLGFAVADATERELRFDTS